MPKELKQISFTLELPKHLVVSLNAIYSGAHWHKRHEIKEGYKALTRVLFKRLAEKFGEFNAPCAISLKPSPVLAREYTTAIIMSIWAR